MSTRRHRKYRRVLLISVGVFFVVLVAARIALPAIVRDQLNKRLDRMGVYQGHVAAVQIHLWRGAYSLHGADIVKMEGKVTVPFFEVAVLDLAISWAGVLHGGILGRAKFNRPELNFVDGENKSAGQSGKGDDWRAQLEALVPIRLDEVVVQDGTMSFRNFSSAPRGPRGNCHQRISQEPDQRAREVLQLPVAIEGGEAGIVRSMSRRQFFVALLPGRMEARALPP